MTTEIIYEGDLHTQAVHIKSGNQITTDAPIDNNGKGQAFSPTDLVAAALGSCMLTIMGIAARTHNIDMNGAKACVMKYMASNPRRIQKLEVIIDMPDIDYNEKEKKILEAAAHGCPVKQSLHPELEEAVTIKWK